MGELNTLGLKYGTDKNNAKGHHAFCDIYESYLKGWKYKNIALIELGVGGYHFPDRGGESLRMWYEYFTNAKLIGVDIYPKEGIIKDRTELWQGSQTDKDLLHTIIERNADAPLRILIDDASHHNKLTVESFNVIFPMLKSGDLYFVEDLQTSYWETEEFGGSEIPGTPGTSMAFFTDLTHQLNWEFHDYVNEFANQISFIHFYKELIVIKKK